MPMLTDKRIKRILKTEAFLTVERELQNDNRLDETVKAARTAFELHESRNLMSTYEFLYTQASLIRKRWWIMQALLLGVLWLCLYFQNLVGSSSQMMGAAAPLFGMLIVPEMWKNRSSNSVEIEGTAYYSLRQVCSARIMIFSLADLFLLSVFYGIASATLELSLVNFIIDFLIPFTVSCGICFLAMTGPVFASEYMVLLMCVVWSIVWMTIVMNERIYKAISIPVWIGTWLFSLGFLIWSVRRSQAACDKCWEVECI